MSAATAEPLQRRRVMNQDEIKGKVEKVKGKAKQAAGDLTDDPQLYEEGLDDEAEGEARDTFGKARRKVGEAVEDVGKAIKR
jgi:uncharacterized protein YjbJ (UPF0337 family)